MLRSNLYLVVYRSLLAQDIGAKLRISGKLRNIS